ncbi:MAG: histidine--tRNA ligase [Chitinophagaceae bacterium]|nr:histidine--tRNA ligase [Chitinophagaceae bacterium]
MKEKAKNKLGVEPYKGVRDFYPEDMAIQKYIFNVMAKTAESFGYCEYGASVLEPSELYRAKSGEEIVNNQMYSFIDRGEREVSLRPEMTPTVARMIAAKRKEMSFPARWYSIPNLFRYERPQRGRVREHWQLNVDIFGIDGIEAEIEIISLAYKLMKNFGAKDSDFVVRINSRVLMNEYFEKLGLKDEQIYKLQKLIDKKSKIDQKEYEAGLLEIAGKKIKVNINPNKKIEKLIFSLQEIGVNNVVFDPELMRGLDYYTDIVFEIFDTNPENSRAMFGGGRYDDLLTIFGVEKVPAVGFGMGDVTIRDFLETRKLLPQYKSPAQLYVCVIDEKTKEFATNFAMSLRDSGINVSVDYSLKKVGDQIKKASKDGVSYIVCIGENETKTNLFKVKNLETGIEKELSIEKIADSIKNKK